MTTKTETNVYDQVFENIKKATDAGLKMQQEAIVQWTALWPAAPSPQSVWVDKVREFQKQWGVVLSELAHRHRTTLDQQYEAALESFEEALQVGESSDPEEFRKRTEQFFRKTLDCMREASEAQMKEYQEAMGKLSELVTKVGS
ncbi:MAG: hypothetical protein F9B45_10900 [Phycisphaera sp. RhM]|nr:hypothetical protein [Phycisphaera sp. RhM]